MPIPEFNCISGDKYIAQNAGLGGFVGKLSEWVVTGLSV